MKILFICRHNRFRSKVAEAIFNEVAGSKFEEMRNADAEHEKLIAESAGILIDELHLYISENVVKIMKEKGYEIKGLPRKVDGNRINDYDMLIIVADNVEKEFFNNFEGRIMKWEVSDCDENDIVGIRKRIDEIERRVKRVVRVLSRR